MPAISRRHPPFFKQAPQALEVTARDHFYMAQISRCRSLPFEKVWRIMVSRNAVEKVTLRAYSEAMEAVSAWQDEFFAGDHLPEGKRVERIVMANILHLQSCTISRGSDTMRESISEKDTRDDGLSLAAQEGEKSESEGSRVIRILLADDHALVREGTRRLIEAESDLKVVAEASSGEEAIAAVKQSRPDIAIMDIAMPGMSGIEATRAIKADSAETAVLVLSAYDDEPYLVALLEAGAAGFLLKNVNGHELVEAIRAVARGEAVLQPALNEKVMRRFSSHSALSQRPADLLSEREFDVLRLAARGLPNKEIARRMNLSIRTVHSHLANIFMKMRVGSRTEAVLLALRQGMISLQDTYDDR
jgi:DNA-binding NarL/FixJ family response regulator